jgi:hypothetical protein
MLFYPVVKLALGKAFPIKMIAPPIFGRFLCHCLFNKRNDCSVFLKKIEHNRLSAKPYVGEVL